MTTDTRSAVHFGAGNIGRGFIGLVLHRAGYDVTFVDVDAALVEQLDSAAGYTVEEVGGAGTIHTVDRCSAIDARREQAAAVHAVSRANVVTCAVGPAVLSSIAPIIREGLVARDPHSPPLVVMACENAIGASDTLRRHVAEGHDELVAEKAIFANTAVDRIIPLQTGEGLDLRVEDFSEWTIERRPRLDEVISIPDAHFVDDLAPYVERKLFTMNTGHATAAYHGLIAGARTIADALTLPSVRAEVEAALAETASLLVATHPIIAKEHPDYVRRALQRLENPALPDTCLRIGRHPLRKISRHERLISPAAQIIESGKAPVALVRAFGAALHYRNVEDAESRELERMLAAQTPQRFVREATGIDAAHPLSPMLVAAMT
ncbi:mannitol-1-phosphate 5-dehydrogenase [Microbacterium sp. PMB16]|uniref:mannitol-1-phosphate 5-dehydrogenase n=1 Tax=Microbacterium sp. PMB16 TaxID=3120157 RepID=UPI003F4C5D13